MDKKTKIDKENIRRIKITILGIIGLILLVIGISFSAFSANLAGTKRQSINTGCLKIDMTDKGSLNIANAVPESDESGLASTPYTYTITNSCTTDAFYTTTINVMDGSNTDNLSKVKVSLDGDSYLAPTFESNLPAGELLDTETTGVLSTYKLDEGYLKVGESKTFELRTWIDYDVEDITGGLENKIIINSEARGKNSIIYKTNTSGYYALSKSSLITNADYKQIAPSANQLSGIIKVEDDSNIKYYFRGNPKNYLTFAGKNFRVLSTNEDGSINIVLASTTGNSTYSNIATSLTSFYNTINSEETYIKTDSTFCKESASSGNYLADLRYNNYNPSIKCQGDSFTKVGLLTVDDLMFAGAKKDTANTSFYLKDTTSYFTSSSKSSTENFSYSTSNSITSTTNTTSIGVKPVITLKSNVMLQGEGTETSPFYVNGLYEQAKNNYNDTVKPVIDIARVDEKWSKTNKNIEITAHDDSTGSGIAGYLISTSSTTPSVTSTSWEASSQGKYESVQSYANGTYYVFVKDNAGNISEAKKVVIEKVDKTAPTCTIRINPNGEMSTYKTLSIISSDTNIDLDGYSWGHTDSTEDVIKINANGSYTGYVTDLAGNKGSCTGVVTTIRASAATMLTTKVGESGLEEVTHTADSTLQIGEAENITEYRFRGGNSVVTNNYVYFNCSDINNQTADTCELYRIIGIFPVDDGTGSIENRIKLIKAENYGNNYWNSNGTNNWAEPATLNTTLNTTYWNAINEKYQALVGDAKYYLGGYTTADINTSVMYGYERKIDESDGGNYYYDTNPTNWTGKIALMYASDYGYGANSACSESTTLLNYETNSCPDNNWLYLGVYEWLLPHYSGYSNRAFPVDSNGCVGNRRVDGGNYAVRPVLYLTSDAQFNDIGDGSSNNPYQLME